MPDLDLIEMLPASWEKAVDGLLTHQPTPTTDSEWLDFASALESRGTHMLLLSEYIAQRRGEYCGDHNSHSVAARAVTRLHKKLREALGYTLPDAGLLKL